MINLPNGCGCSNLSVHPKNWKSRSAKMSQDWYITYRFYDPRYPKPKLVMVKGMNHFKVLSERQQATENILQKEMDKLLNDGFNPCHNAKTLVIPVGHLNKDMGILDALNTVANTLDVSAYTKRDLRSMLKTVGKAIVNLGLGKYCISQVTRKIIKMILEKSSNSSDRFNKNRSYLLILFSELCELEIIENNPVRDIRKKKIVKRIRQVLSTSERQMVDTHLRENYPEFHQFLNIFFHSGLRISEILRIKKTDVDISNQRFKMTILKGRQQKEVWRTIKDIVLPRWIQILNTCDDEDYLFSIGIRPGKKPIQPYQVTKRWYRLVKKKLGIKADFYSLKHLHTTEIVELLNEEEAAKHNAHTSTAMVRNIYDVKRGTRKDSKVKGLNNRFAN